LREFNVDANVGEPRVSYKETITENAVEEHRLVRQTGGHGMYAVVKLEVEPLRTGEGIEFESRIKGGMLSASYIAAVEEGVRASLEAGPLGGYPVVDVKITLLDGKMHDVDSSELAFKTAGSLAARDVVRKAGPALMEPIMDVEVVTPDEYTGNVINEINSRGGIVDHVEPQGSGGTSAVRANVPLRKMFGFATDLRSQSQGRGTYTMEFSHYSMASDIEAG
jgi:elongation factor G